MDAAAQSIPLKSLGLYTLIVGLVWSGGATAAPCDKTDSKIPDIDLQVIAEGLEQPVHITHAGDGSGRLFVVEQAGRVRIIEQGRLLPEPFLDIRQRVDSGGEKGLLSIAFHPRYKDNGLFYLNYTTRSKGLQTIIARFRRSTPDRADPASEAVLLTIPQPYSNHNGGQLAFGPDGYLYIGMGDGGAANDPHGHGQNPSTLLGAMLRINIDDAGRDAPYTIPRDNPFRNRPDHRPEIWAYGLRNPWRFSFDALNGRLYAADVGQNDVEEIDIVVRGGNYGWNIVEGNICTPGVNANCKKSGFAPPLFTYPHPQGFSITGGVVYRGQAIAELCATYLYADYVTQRLWGLRHDDKKIVAHRQLLNESGAFDRLRSLFGQSGLHISSFGEDESREVYVTNHRSGQILKIIAAEGSPQNK